MSIKKAIWMILTVAMVHTVSAQKFGEQPKLNDPLANRKCERLAGGAVLSAQGTLEDAAVEYLNTENPNFLDAASQPVLQYHKTSPGGEHLSFVQYYNSVEVFDSEVKLNLDKNRKLLIGFDNSYDPAYLDGKAIDEEANMLNDLVLGNAFKAYYNMENAEVEESVVLVFLESKPRVVKRLIVLDMDKGFHRLYLVNANMEVLLERDLVAYGQTPAQLTIFDPDPLTTASTGYLAPFVDSSDADVAVINAQRKTVTMGVDLTGGVYSLENDYIAISEFSQPANTIVTSTTPFFNYTRSQTGFEQVNTYYHLTTFNNYVRNLGFDSLANNWIRADPDALSGNDNSQFIGSSTQPSLFFGSGGVDDAEDADVIVHEYGHGLSYFASPGSNFGSERTAIDEGVGDYLAASYSKSLSNFGWSDIFNWDGHNEYWAGRSAAVSLKYPGDLAGSIHKNGQMWSTALMEIHAIIGATKSDKLALQTLYYFATNITFTDAALAYIEADNILYGGANYNVIFPIFVNRGFLEGNAVGEIREDKGINVANTEGFSFQNEPILITSLNAVTSIQLFDLSGRLLEEKQVDRQYTLSFAPQTHLQAGAYIIKVNTIASPGASFKVVKAE